MGALEPQTPPVDPTDAALAVNPDEGIDPAQPDASAAVLGGAPTTYDRTEGAPPFVMRRLSLEEWRAYCAGYQFGSLAPSRLVLHHTVIPTEETWAGLSTMRGMQRFYAGKGWTSSPHLYCAPDGIWLAAPMSRVGIHAGAGNGSVRAGWYSIGLEMVGRFDDRRPSGPVWAYSLAVMGELSRRLGIAPRQLISFHRDYTDQKSCPGRAVAKTWVWGEVEAYLALTTTTTPASHPPGVYTELSPVLAHPPLNAAALANAFFARCLAAGSPYAAEPADPIRGVIVPATLRLCLAGGVDPYIALAQLGHESGWLVSALSQRRDRDGRDLRNGYGIGVTEAKDRATPQHRPGTVYDADVGGYRPAVGFARWEDAVAAQVGRLIAYATRPEGRTAAQQELVAAALRARDLPRAFHGSAPALRALGRAHNPMGRQGAGWASPGTDYGHRLAEKARSLYLAATR